MHVDCPQLNPSDEPQKRQVQFLRYQNASKIVFNIEFRYELYGYQFIRTGTWAANVVKDKDKRERVHDIILNIGSNITCDRASEVKNSYDVKGLLEEALGRSDREFEKDLNRVLNGEKRAYRKYDDLGYLGDRVLPPPYPQPAAAKTDRLILDLGTQRLQLFSARTVTFGRYGDVSWRSPFAGGIYDNMLNNMPYDKISRYQCFFEHSGKDVVLYDGSRKAPVGHENLQRTEFGTYPSAYGTKFNDVRVNGKKLLGTDGSGILSFSDSTAKGKLSVCLPGAACAECTRADRTWCQNGKRPSLVFKRLDGVPESAVMVWSCFWLEELDPSFEGVKIFRSDGGFAWRRGRRCGWLVPGSSIETDCGLVKVERLPTPEEKMESAKKVVRNDTGTCHN